MRRIYLCALAAGAIALTCVWALRAPSSAGAGKEADGKVMAAAPAMPITQINLFNSGVGQALRQGTVTGSARIDLPFAVRDINDLLKSVTVQDLDGGRIQAIACDSHDPLDKALAGFAVNLTGNPSFAAVLNQVRGEQVEVALAPGAAPATLTGTVMGVETRKRAAGKNDVEEVEQLNLWCRDGARSVKLADVQRINFLSPGLKDEVRQALATLARVHDTRKKTVSLVCVGEGKRRVQAGYVVEHPVWKTSYRLALGKGDKFGLQAWALVENPTDEDWKDVRLALIAGRPISFRMDLYQPLYVPRPLVELEQFAGLRPPTYRGPLDSWRVEAMKGKAGRPGFPGEAPAPGPGSGANEPPVKPAALGDFFQYLLDDRVTLPRQKSALFPIARKDVAGKRVSIYNERTQAKYPLLGVRFKNSTDLHLSSGPITVYEGNSYAGDAVVPNLQPGEERLLSYAIDLGTEVAPVPTKTAERLTAIKVQRGILTATAKVRDAKAYRIKNRSPQHRLVLIEHPSRPDYRLVDTVRPVEMTREHYRFEVKVPAGKSVVLSVNEEKVLAKVVRLAGSEDETVRFYLSSTVASPALKAALEKAMALRARVAESDRAIGRTVREEKELVDDQKRLRDNMARVPQSSLPYKRYLEKLVQQEGQIEKLQEAKKKLRATQEQQQKDYEEHLSGLSVE